MHIQNNHPVPPSGVNVGSLKKGKVYKRGELYFMSVGILHGIYYVLELGSGELYAPVTSDMFYLEVDSRLVIGKGE